MYRIRVHSYLIKAFDLIIALSYIAVIMQALFIYFYLTFDIINIRCCISCNNSQMHLIRLQIWRATDRSSTTWHDDKVCLTFEMCVVTCFFLSSCSLYTWNRSKVAPPSPAPGIHLLLHLSPCLFSQRMAAAQAGSGLRGTRRDGQVALLMPLELCMCVFLGWGWLGMGRGWGGRDQGVSLCNQTSHSFAQVVFLMSAV